MNSIMKYYKGSFIATFVGAAIAFAFLGGASAMMTAMLLAILEISLSFDNAVVNAKNLKDMDPVWQRRFLSWGMPIAVFGMRLFFPLAIVAIIAGMSMWAAFMMAMNAPDQYATILKSSHVMVAGFGGAFLMMVFLKFFFDKEKEIHWIEFVERHLRHLEATEIAITLGITYVISLYLEAQEAHHFIVASIMGLITFIAVEWVGELLEGDEGHGVADVTVAVARTGLAAFIYLEILDASFSFDGVIGAFALTNNIFLILIGLGVGAMFVRSMTIQLVDTGTLSEFKYLEHGAFWSIGFLAALMFISAFHEVPEIITGVIAAVFIIAALISSIVANKNQGTIRNN